MGREGAWTERVGGIERNRQRVLNDLQRVRVSCRRMIRLLAHPLPPSSVNKLSLFPSLPMCRQVELTDGKWRAGGAREELNHTTARKSGPLQII